MSKKKIYIYISLTNYYTVCISDYTKVKRGIEDSTFNPINIYMEYNLLSTKKENMNRIFYNDSMKIQGL